jgi:putative FmdB family regulatory protein
MPIFDYRCRGCGNEFELIVLKTTVVACPACEGRDLEQKVSWFAVSTESMRKSNLQSARRKLKASANYRDQKVAEVEEIREHAPHLVKPTKSGQ